MGQMEDLRLFTVIVENHSLSKAADRLNIAKSTVSRRLNPFGRPLFSIVD